MGGGQRLHSEGGHRCGACGTWLMEGDVFEGDDARQERRGGEGKRWRGEEREGEWEEEGERAP